MWFQLPCEHLRPKPLIKTSALPELMQTTDRLCNITVMIIKLQQNNFIEEEGTNFTFSAMMRSPTSNVGYMDKDGMNRGSATNHLKRIDMVKSATTVLPSSDVKFIHLGSQLDPSTSLTSSVVVKSTLFCKLIMVDSLVLASASPRLRARVSVFSSWLLRDMWEDLFLLTQGDWKNWEHGSLSRPCIRAELGIPAVLVMRVLEYEDEEMESLLVSCGWKNREQMDVDDGAALNFLSCTVFRCTSPGTTSATPATPAPDRVAAHGPACLKPTFQDWKQQEEQLGPAFTFRGLIHLVSLSTARKCFTPMSRIGFVFTQKREHETATCVAISANFRKQIQRRKKNRITRLTTKDSCLEKEWKKLGMLWGIGTS